MFNKIYIFLLIFVFFACPVNNTKIIYDESKANASIVQSYDFGIEYLSFDIKDQQLYMFNHSSKVSVFKLENDVPEYEINIRPKTYIKNKTYKMSHGYNFTILPDDTFLSSYTLTDLSNDLKSLILNFDVSGDIIKLFDLSSDFLRKSGNISDMGYDEDNSIFWIYNDGYICEYTYNDNIFTYIKQNKYVPDYFSSDNISRYNGYVAVGYFIPSSDDSDEYFIDIIDLHEGNKVKRSINTKYLGCKGFPKNILYDGTHIWINTYVYDDSEYPGYHFALLKVKPS